MDIQLKKLENPIFRCYLVSKAHKNKIPTAVPMFLGMSFSIATRNAWQSLAYSPLGAIVSPPSRLSFISNFVEQASAIG